MEYAQALKLAVSALEKARRVHTFDANLYKRGIVSERTMLAVREYDKYTQAIDILKHKEKG
jgi:hypothetical protein